MKRRIAVLFTIVSCAAALMPQAAQENSPNRNVGVEAPDLNRDLARMQVLLSQMQKNAAFVSRGDTPLKHEFELEMEMWQILLNDMEKRVNAAEPR
jgi:hypothetical protein